MDRQGTCRHPFEHDCFLLRRAEARTISACSAGMRLSFLYRLGRSKYRDKFALKGATLSSLWTGQTHRPTKDLDLLGRGLSSSIAELEALIREICEIRQEDGIVFDGEVDRGISDQRRGRIRWRTRQIRPSWLELEFRCRSI